MFMIKVFLLYIIVYSYPVLNADRNVHQGISGLVLERAASYIQDYVNIADHSSDIHPFQVLDIFSLSENFTINSNKLKLNAHLEGSLEGPNFNVYDCQFSNFNIGLDGSIEKFNFQGKYNMEGIALNLFPLKGEGKIMISLQKGLFNTSLNVEPVSGVIFIRDFQFEYDVIDFKVDIGGLIDQHIGSVLEAFIGDFIPSALHKERRKISIVVENILKGKKLRLEDIMAGLKNLI